jgi:ankyrin repeat protein
MAIATVVASTLDSKDHPNPSEVKTNNKIILDELMKKTLPLNEKDSIALQNAIKELNAATKIQSLERGKQARSEVKRKLLEQIALDHITKANKTKEQTELNAATTAIKKLLNHKVDLAFTTVDSKTAAGQYLLTLLNQDPPDNNLIINLINAGADVNQKSKDGGNTPLDIAIMKKNTSSEIIIALFKNNQGLKFTTVDSKTAAGQYLLTLLNQDPPDSNLIINLINAGADVNQKSKDGGNTPLGHAVINGNHAVLKILLDKGASVTEKNSAEFTPLELAEGKLEKLKKNDENKGEIKNFKECIKLLTEATKKQKKTLKKLIQINKKMRNKRKKLKAEINHLKEKKTVKKGNGSK